MAIYLWVIPENYPEKLIGRYERERSPDRFSFRQGKYLSNSQISSVPIIKFNSPKKQLEHIYSGKLGGLYQKGGA